MGLTFQQTVAQRRSVRGFLPAPVPREVIDQALNEARLAPSSCNTQPWVVHVVSGAPLARLSQELLQAAEGTVDRHDFGYDISKYYGVYADRRDSQGKQYYGAIGIPRGDVDARLQEARRNFEFFGAPHLALFFVPSIPSADMVSAADIGMFAQTFMLSLVSRGYGSIAQGSIANFPATIRSALGVSDDLRLIFGIAFGSEDPHAKSAGVRIDRADVSEIVTYHDQ